MIDTESLVLSARDGAVFTLTLNRPEARNALSDALIADLQGALDKATKDPAVRVIILAASGPAFCAGHDLKELTGHRKEYDKGANRFRATFNECSTMMKTIVNYPVPIIAQVQGVATAAGCQLVASCDLAVASTEAKFATPGVNIGLFCSTPMVALSRNVTRKHAMEMLLTGDIISAEKAAAIGLVNDVVAAGQEHARAIELARQVASKSSHVIGLGKAAFYRQIELPLAEAYAYASKVMTENMMARDAEEGICAFIEKRNPSWEDR